MADIIDFRAKTKAFRKNNKPTDNGVKMGEIILFSGVRIQRDDVTELDTQLPKHDQFLETKSQ